MLDRTRKRYEFIKWEEDKTVEGYDENNKPYYSSSYIFVLDTPKDGVIEVSFSEQDLMSLTYLMKKVL